MSAVVIGASGNIGRAAAFGFLQQKNISKVFIVGRDGKKLEELKQSYLDNDSRVVVVVADVTTSDGAKSVWEQISKAVQKIDHVVSSSGPWWSVPKLFDTDAKTFDDAVRSNVSAHFYVWAALAKHVTTSYVIVNGAAMNMLPGSSLTGICANAVNGFAKVAMQEGKALNLRVHEFLIVSRVADGEGPHAIPTKKFSKFFSAIANGDVSKENVQILGDGNAAAKFL